MIFYVATNGCDRWSGRLPEPNAARTDGPLASLSGARDAIRRRRVAGGPDEPVEVRVRGGLYRLSEPLRLGPGDSGTAASPITYRACPGEHVVISGGRRITGWEPHGDGVFQTSLPEVRRGTWHVRQLFCNGQRLTRARWPKRDPHDPLYGGWAFVETPLPEGDDLDQVTRQELGPVWQFKTDPEGAGETQSWFAPEHPDSDWGQLRSGMSWTTQGFREYHGTAWYRLRFTVPPEVAARKHLWLLFGAVDKEAYVYVDGRKAFEHTAASTGLDLDVLYDQPFKFDLRPFLRTAGEHVVAVRVDSAFFAGGITQPVALVGADAEVAAGYLAGRVDVPVVFRYAQDQLPAHWCKPSQGEVFIVVGKGWVNDIVPIKTASPDRRTIHLARAVRPDSPSLHVATTICSGNRFYVENMLEDLTEPGEWCLDGDTGTLYFRPPDGLTIDTVEVTAPVTERLIQMTGTPLLPVRHITVNGFTFTQTLANFPNPNVYYKTPNAGQAVYLENAQDCRIEDNVFAAVGGDAIRLQNANARCVIAGNEIAYAGAYGIFVGSFQKGFARHDTQSGDNPSPTEWHTNLHDREATVLAWPRSAQHVIADNHIHHVGVYEKHACGVCLFGVSSIDITIRNNRIHNIPRFGIGLLSGFGRVTVEYNDLHHLSEETCDTGGICSNRWYTWDGDPDLARGCIIRFNRIRDVIGCGAYGRKAEPGGIDRAGGRIWAPYYSWAIYFDNAPMDTLVYGNICARNALGGMMISHWGKNVTVENNIFVDSEKSQIYLLLAGRMSGIRFRRNIFAYTDPNADVMRLNLSGEQGLQGIVTEFDGNLYWPPSGCTLTFSGLPGEAVVRSGMTIVQQERTLADWHALGFDRNSVVADPGFVDPAHDNYDLRPDSPALALGFVPIDTTQIGPRPRQRDVSP
jgi:hypothetical protein